MSTDDEARVLCPHCASINRMPAEKSALLAHCGNCHQRLFDGRSIAVDTTGLDHHRTSDTIPLLVDTWAPWCPPCRAMGPLFEKAARMLEPDFRLLKLNVDDAPEIMARYGIRGIPTLLLFERGRLKAKHAGAMDDVSIASWARTRLVETDPSA